MNVEIETEAPIFHFLEYLFKIFGILSLQCRPTLLQGLLKMKLSSGKLQFWGCKKPPFDSGTFCPSPILLFYILPCWKYLPVSGARPSPCCYRKIP
jgi:hypothetical protein